MTFQSESPGTHVNANLMNLYLILNCGGEWGENEQGRVVTVAISG